MTEIQSVDDAVKAVDGGKSTEPAAPAAKAPRPKPAKKATKRPAVKKAKAKTPAKKVVKGKAK